MKRNFNTQIPAEITPEMHFYQAGQPNAILNGYTSLDIAIARNDIEQAINILNNTVFTNQNLHNNQGITPFHLAIYLGNMEIVLAFLRKNPQWVHVPDAEGALALHWAAKAGHYYLIQPLLTAGANIYTKNSQGQTPYYIALPLAGDLNILMGATNDHQRFMQTLNYAHMHHTMDGPQPNGVQCVLSTSTPSFISSMMGTIFGNNSNNSNNSNNQNNQVDNHKRLKQDSLFNLQ